MEINGLIFNKTCSGNPEMHYVSKDGINIAYVRLRHGCLSARVFSGGDYINSIDAQEVYYYEFEDEEGCFPSEKSRTEHLNAISEAINKSLEDGE